MLWSLLAFVAAICAAIGFIPNRDLNTYDSLAAGDGIKVEGTIVGTATVVTSGRRRTGGTVRQCASYRYEGSDGGEKFFTDRHDCYRHPTAVPKGQSARLLATKSLEAKFVFSDATRDELLATGRWMHWIGIGGVVMLVTCIIALVVLIRRRPA